MTYQEEIQAMKDKERANRRKLYHNKKLFDYIEARTEHFNSANSDACRNSSK